MAWSPGMSCILAKFSRFCWNLMITRKPTSSGVFYPILHSQILVEEMLILLTFATWAVMEYLQESLDVPSMRSVWWETVRNYASRVLQWASRSDASTWLGAIAQMKMLQDKDFLWRCHDDWNIACVTLGSINTANRCGEHSTSYCIGYTELWYPHISNRMTLWYQCWQWYHDTR